MSIQPVGASTAQYVPPVQTSAGGARPVEASPDTSKIQSPRDTAGVKTADAPSSEGDAPIDRKGWEGLLFALADRAARAAPASAACSGSNSTMPSSPACCSVSACRCSRSRMAGT